MKKKSFDERKYVHVYCIGHKCYDSPVASDYRIGNEPGNSIIVETKNC